MQDVITLSPSSDVDKFCFRQMLAEALNSDTPKAICAIEYPADMFETWLVEGRLRTAVNKKLGNGGPTPSEIRQYIRGSDFTSDEIGRACEGPVELMLDGLSVKAVNLEGTEPDPDVALAGRRVDVKGTDWNRKNTFSVKCSDVKKYDSLLLIRTERPGLVQVWACRCNPAAWGDVRKGTQGRPNYYLIDCKH